MSHSMSTRVSLFRNSMMSYFFVKCACSWSTFSSWFCLSLIEISSVSYSKLSSVSLMLGL